jgi:hypothetical protein
MGVEEFRAAALARGKTEAEINDYLASHGYQKEVTPEASALEKVLQRQREGVAAGGLATQDAKDPRVGGFIDTTLADTKDTLKLAWQGSVEGTVGSAAFLSGWLLKGLARPAFGPVAGETFEGIDETGNKLIRYQQALYDDVIETQGDILARDPSSMAASVAVPLYTGTQFISPIRWIKTAAVILGMAPKAAALAYGIYRGSKGMKKLVEGAKRLGDVDDAFNITKALDSADAVDDVSKQAARGMAASGGTDGIVDDLAGNLGVQRQRLRDAVSVQQQMETGRRPLSKGGDDLFAGASNDEVLSFAKREIGNARAEINRISRAMKSEPDLMHRPLSIGPLKQAVKREELSDVGESLAYQYIENRDVMLNNAATRANQALKSLKSGKGSVDKQLLEDITFLQNGTANPNIVGDTVDDLAKRIAGHPNGEKAIRYATETRHFNDEFFAQMDELSGEIGGKMHDYKENYLFQEWVLSSKGAAKLIDEPLVKGVGRFERASALKNYAEGIEAGFTPRTLKLPEIMYLRETEHARVMATKRLLSDIAAIDITDTGMPAMLRGTPGAKVVNPQEYVEVNIPYLRTLAGAKPGELVYIHNQIAEPLKNILTAAHRPNSFEKFAALAKRLNFSFSIYHAYTLTESAINALGPIRGLRAAAKFGFGIPGIAHSRDVEKGMASILEGTDMARRFTQKATRAGVTPAGAFREAAEKQAIGAGTTVGAPRVDIMLDAWNQSIDAVERGLKGVPGAVKALEGYRQAQRWFDVGLWERFHHPMKVSAFNLLYDDMLKVKAGESMSMLRRIPGLKNIKNMSDDQIARSVASFVNDEFGGQNWELLTKGIMSHISKPSRLRAFRALWTSPDWNISSIRATLAFTQVLPGKAHDPVRGLLGLKHWANAAAGSYVYYNILNKILSGHFMFENEPGRKFYVDTGTTVRDKNGRLRTVYAPVGKQYKEAPNTVLKDGKFSLAAPADFVVRKLLPVWGNSLQVIMNSGDFEENIASIKREAGEIDGARFSAEAVKHAAKGLVPFGWSGFDFERYGVWGALPFPKALSMGPQKAEELVFEALSENNFQDYNTVISALHAAEFKQSDIDRIVSRARGRAKKSRQVQ